MKGSMIGSFMLGLAIEYHYMQDYSHLQCAQYFLWLLTALNESRNGAGAMTLFFLSTIFQPVRKSRNKHTAL